jgi:hypothetical protein
VPPELSSPQPGTRGAATTAGAWVSATTVSLKIAQWSKSYWEALHPYSAGGAYVNSMMDEGEESIKATYRDNYVRLSSFKRKYDPTNLFRVNQNIKSAA